jgi:hypothetical protein
MLVMATTLWRRLPPTRARVATAMTTQSARQDSSEEEDRVVSRRVDNPTAADPGDERAYRAADPGAAAKEPDTDDGGTGSTTERAGRDLDADDESEPTRSE